MFNTSQFHVGETSEDRIGSDRSNTLRHTYFYRSQILQCFLFLPSQSKSILRTWLILLELIRNMFTSAGTSWNTIWIRRLQILPCTFFKKNTLTTSFYMLSSCINIKLFQEPNMAPITAMSWEYINPSWWLVHLWSAYYFAKNQVLLSNLAACCMKPT